MFSNVSFGYLLFHAVLTIPIISILVYLQPRLKQVKRKRRRYNFYILILIAYIYTIPWDNLMIAFDTWWYGDVVTLKIWEAPLGEYLFFGIQTIIMGLYLYLVGFDPKPIKSDLRLFPRIIGSAIFMIISLFFFFILIFGDQSLFYASSLIAWTGPVIALQWLVGGTYILRKWKKLLITLIPPTMYLWIIDAYAISTGLWTISQDLTIGLYIGPMPIEEMLFFLSANVMTVFGMVLYEWVLEVWKSGRGIFIQSNNNKVCRFYNLLE